MIRKLYNSTLILLLFLFFPAFVGVFLPNLITFLIIITTLVLKFNDIKKLFIEYSKLSYYFSFFYILIFLSSIFSNHVIHSLESSLLYFAYILFVFSLIIFFRNREKNFIIFLYFGIISFFLISIDAIYEIINGSNVLGYSSIDGRIAGMFNDRWVIGSYLVRFTVLLGIFFKFKISPNTGFFYFFFFWLKFNNYCISGERVAYLLLLLLLFLIILLLF